ncbi:MAG: hypothetical protein WC506_03005 [Candidatus Micrarchaeia archaeon]
MQPRNFAALFTISLVLALFFAGCATPGSNPAQNGTSNSSNNSPVYTVPSEVVNGTRIPALKAHVHEMPYDRQHEFYYADFGNYSVAFGSLNLSGTLYPAYIYYYQNESYLFNPATPGKALLYPANATIYGFNAPSRAAEVRERFADGTPKDYLVDSAAGSKSEITVEQVAITMEDYPFITGIPSGVQATPIDDFEVNVNMG